jgi:hypothetical protein
MRSYGNGFPSRLQKMEWMRECGTILHMHKLVCRRADRRQFIGTFFHRDRPQLELMLRLTGRKTREATLNVAILGCRNWRLRGFGRLQTADCTRRLTPHRVDYAGRALAARATTSAENPWMLPSSIKQKVVREAQQPLLQK